MLRFLLVFCSLTILAQGGVGRLPAGASPAGLTAPLTKPQRPVAADYLTSWQWESGGRPLIPIALDAHSSGLICGIEATRHRLFLADSLGGSLRFATRSGSGPSLGFATRVFSRWGLQIFTLDGWNGQIERYDLRGEREGLIDLTAELEAAGDDLGEIVDFCVDPSGEMFALDAARGRILHFARDGTFLDIVRESGEMTLEAPVAIDVDGHGRLFLLETQPPALTVLDADGRLLRRALATAEAPADAPTSLAVDLWGNAFVADAAAGVLVLPSGGRPWWLPPPPGECLSPESDLALLGTKRLLLTGGHGGRVCVFALRYESAAKADRTPSRSGGDAGDAQHRR